LKNHVPIAVNTGLSGIPYWGTDIGGFVPTAEYTGELHVRWFQFAAFCPSFRAHGRHWHLKLPWGWNGGDGGPKETNAFTPAPEELKNPETERIMKKYLELRYRLLPYIYTAARETSETGLPMMRAMWLHHSDDPIATTRGDQFFWGRDLLVAPVVEKGAIVRKVYLPRGAWFDFWTEERIEGGREIDRAVDLETTPLYARAGAIVPTGPLKQYSDEPVDGPLTLTAYPGANGAALVYDDDGKSFDYRKGQFSRLEARWDDRARRVSLSLAPGSRMLPSTARAIEIVIAGEKKRQAVKFDGKPIEVRM
jgi:alpha-glucosidase/alpha-D-xyloside xylohydrolase